jgi:hypothetical protein
MCFCGNQYKFSHSPKKKKIQTQIQIQIFPSKIISELCIFFFRQKDPTMKQDHIIDYSNFTAVNYDPA